VRTGAKSKATPLDFIVDGLTKSIVLAATGERFETMVLPIEKKDLPAISKKAGWLFDWRQIVAEGFAVYKLVTVKEPKVIQGLVAFKENEDHLYMRLLESAPFNVGKGKKFIGSPGNLVAFGCLMSRQKGFRGFLAFIPKTALMEHYERTLGARRILGTNRMAIYEPQAEFLINQYFPNPEQDKEDNNE
jgi:hypothetical protein